MGDDVGRCVVVVRKGKAGHALKIVVLGHDCVICAAELWVIDGGKESKIGAGIVVTKRARVA